jgi:hypothetical protein
MHVSSATVRRRKVFYIPGFDPRPARRYREVYRREGARQAAISGHEIALTARRAGTGPTQWRVRARMEGAVVDAEIEVLVWSDLVASSMARGIWASYAGLWRTAVIYLRSGALGPLARLRRGPLLAALYPVVMLLLQAGLALGGAALGFSGAVAMIGGAGGVLAGVMLGSGVGGAVLVACHRADRWLFAHYLMHDFAFSASAHGDWPPALVARITAFAARIQAALSEDFDEVLVVGHSSGAILAVSAVAEVWRAGGLGKDPGPVACAQDWPHGGAHARALGLLTLGQCIPMMSFLPQARQLRRDLHDLAGAKTLAWVDVTAPGDVCAHALCDPVAVSGVAPTGQIWPLVISAAFSRTVAPVRWARLRWRFFAVHFQYLCAFEAPEGYDYFAITAGPRTLRARYAGRAPSPGCIRTALSAHRSLAPAPQGAR